MNTNLLKKLTILSGGATLMLLCVCILSVAIFGSQLGNTRVGNPICTYNDAKLEGNCAYLEVFEEKFSSRYGLSQAEFKALFVINNNPTGASFSIKSDLAFRELLTKVHSISQQKDPNQYLVNKGTAVLLTNYIPTANFDLEATIVGYQNYLTGLPQLYQQNLPLIIAESSLPTAYDGKPTKIFSKKVSTGTARVALREKSRVAELKKGLDNLNGLVVAPQSEFSFADRMLAKLYRQTGKDTFVELPGQESKIAYGRGVCGAATALYRAVLEAGLTITERHAHSKEYTNYLYPYGVLMDATVFFAASNLLDLKFKNDTDSELYIKATYTPSQDGFLYYSVEIYAQDTFKLRAVSLGDFKRFDSTAVSVRESFSRTVDGVTKTASSKYSRIHDE